MVDARFEPGTSAPEVWCAINEPPHTGFTLRSQQVSKKIGLYSTAVRKSSQNPLVTKMRLNIDKDLKSRDIVPSSSY